MSEPVVVTVCPCCPVPRRARLADVLVVAAGRWAPDARSADLFEHYPGLTVVLVVGHGGVVAAVRDGRTLTLRCSGRHLSAGAVHAMASALYHCWCVT